MTNTATAARILDTVRNAERRDGRLMRTVQTVHYGTPTTARRTWCNRISANLTRTTDTLADVTCGVCLSTPAAHRAQNGVTL